MATTTRTSRTQAPSTDAQPEIEYIDLPNTAANRQFLKDWSEMKVQKGYWDAREKALKADLDAKTDYKILVRERGDKIFVRLAGAIRMVFTWAERTELDADLLMQGFPEAYEACKRKNIYPTAKTA